MCGDAYVYKISVADRKPAKTRFYSSAVCRLPSPGSAILIVPPFLTLQPAFSHNDPLTPYAFAASHSSPSTYYSATTFHRSGRWCVLQSATCASENDENYGSFPAANVKLESQSLLQPSPPFSLSLSPLVLQ